MSRCGLDVSQTERDIAFCAHAIMQDEPLIVLDATKDPRFANNPIVLGEPYVRFYAGAPLITAEGVKLGTFCVIDQRRRNEFSEAERATLQKFSARAMDMIYARVFHWLATQEPNSQVQSAREAGSLSSAATRAFLDTVSSEIREPLGAILSLTHIIESEEFRPNDLDQYKAYAQAITASGELLMRTLESTMNCRQAQHGELALKNETIDLVELVQNCALPYQMRARATKIEFRIPQVRDDLPSLSADRAQTEQMVVHLIANAMSVASQGGHVEVAAKTSPGKGIEIRVLGRPAALTKFTAVSRPPQDQAEPIGAARALSEGGTRLAVAKLLIEMHGGRLESVSGARGELTNILTFPPFRALPVEARG
jgi:signal transduction histidine kinase